MKPRRIPARPVGDRGERYPAWLTDLAGASGCYVIRDKATGRALYVGESHTGRLYQTISRHLQAWGRLKAHWVGLLGAQAHDPGTTYDRSTVTVGVVITSPAAAMPLQRRLIRSLKPRDNILETGEPPF
ncbi:MAG: hypothetical protein IT382_01830 [Deltaproteobacteria bacterium]|nr:hypothetical protein [Deltaproteobacteria bacterium]